MLINFLELTGHVELSYSVKYKSYDIVIRQLIPTKSDLPPWFCCYINKGRDFTDDELGLIPAWYGITYDSVYPDSWVKSSLTGRWVLGWDYHHDDENELTESVQDIIKDAHQVIDFIIQTSDGEEQTYMHWYHFYKDEQLLTRLKVFNAVSIILLLITTIFLTRGHDLYLEYFLVFLCGSLASIVFSCVIYLFMKKGLE